MPFYCASCQVLHQSVAEEGSERILAPEENFSQTIRLFLARE